MVSILLLFFLFLCSSVPLFDPQMLDTADCLEFQDSKSRA